MSWLRARRRGISGRYTSHQKYCSPLELRSHAHSSLRRSCTSLLQTRESKKAVASCPSKDNGFAQTNCELYANRVLETSVHGTLCLTSRRRGNGVLVRLTLERYLNSG